MSIKNIYNSLIFLQIVLAAISPLLLCFFGVDLLFARKIMKLNPFSLSTETWSIIVMGYELFCSILLAKIAVLGISFVAFKIGERKSAYHQKVT